MSFTKYPHKTALEEGKPFNYIIDLDERGSFIAHVENENGKVVFRFVAGNELKEDETSIFDDGWMKHEKDITGLESYLKHLQVISENDWLETEN